MARSSATTPQQYIDSLPSDRKPIIRKLREIIRKSIPKGYEEAMNWGAICYKVPLKVLPDTYNGQPLCYVALAAQKNHNAVYLMNVYGDKKKEAWLREEFKKAGKKLDMGKSCVRFKSLDDIPLPAIAKIIASTSLAEYKAMYEQTMAKRKK